MSNAKRQHALINQSVQWLILDAAACPEPLWFARGAGLDTLSLFRQQDEELADSGPWLIAVEGEPGAIDVCLQKDPLGHASLWIASSLGQKPLADVLRSRVYARLPGGETTRFRWYDPRVLSPYVEDLPPLRRDEFLAPFDLLIHADLNPYQHPYQYQFWQRNEAGDSFVRRHLSFMEEI
ncbi:DUF4123 domain-containing protein [Marinobacter daepoensis]|uniref:DUF4123 domain-containing protein n=1 Tax=Marinobacter daepoensis TaxID=262077 RepID=A0ABS3BFV4_9GAMM|nr:DUF4123 domain-containing protein [Marinobacter daepoensis]MBN7770377.1 DUF4123 domain-containing protein [Marinobacter daepoensis]MBY6079823.1 DUF4123 domain-containing protein [Marinobacter daepoensis]